MRNQDYLPLAALIAAAMLAAPAKGYNNNDRWTFTSAGGVAGPIGTPVALTWGIADDGTLVQNVTPGVNRNSNLIAKLDSWYGAGPGGSDLTQRPWFGYVESSFDRWAEVSGITFTYEPYDDGANHNGAAGVAGVRADVRLAGARYDGTIGVNIGTAGYTIAPDLGDIFLDTDDAAYFSNASGNAFSLRHTLMHELGHSLGLGHLTSSNSVALLEPFTQTGFDGPQHDDIRGVHFLYGDALEKNGGNDTIATATPLGVIGGGSVVSVGTDGGATLVTADMSDFISINRSADVDVFSFSVEGASQVNITMTPLGFSYAHQAFGLGSTTIQSDRIGDLGIEVQQLGPSLVSSSLGISNGGGLGAAETLDFTTTEAGSFTLHVTGITNATQFYRLDLAVTSLALPGDYTGDGLVDAADYTRWRDTLGSTTELAADGDGNGEIDDADYDVWASAYGSIFHGAGTSASGAVPEPGALVGATLGLLLAKFRRPNR